MRRRHSVDGKYQEKTSRLKLKALHSPDTDQELSQGGLGDNLRQHSSSSRHSGKCQASSPARNPQRSPRRWEVGAECWSQLTHLLNREIVRNIGSQLKSCW